MRRGRQQCNTDVFAPVITLHLDSQRSTNHSERRVEWAGERVILDIELLKASTLQRIRTNPRSARSVAKLSASYHCLGSVFPLQLQWARTTTARPGLDSDARGRGLARFWPCFQCKTTLVFGAGGRACTSVSRDYNDSHVIYVSRHVWHVWLTWLGSTSYVSLAAKSMQCVIGREGFPCVGILTLLALSLTSGELIGYRRGTDALREKTRLAVI